MACYETEPQHATASALRMGLSALYWYVGLMAMRTIMLGIPGKISSSFEEFVSFVFTVGIYALVAAFCLRGVGFLQFSGDAETTSRRKANFRKGFEQKLVALDVPITAKDGRLTVHARMALLDSGGDPLEGIRLPPDHPALKRSRVTEWFLDQ
jgi:hypothetical protein